MSKMTVAALSTFMEARRIWRQPALRCIHGVLFVGPHNSLERQLAGSLLPGSFLGTTRAKMEVLAEGGFQKAHREPP
jgi:hypothetical protein